MPSELPRGWWRLLRREAFAGQTCADHTEIEQAVAGATARLNGRARPWIWGRPHPRDEGVALGPLHGGDLGPVRAVD